MKLKHIYTAWYSYNVISNDIKMKRQNCSMYMPGVSWQMQMLKDIYRKYKTHTHCAKIIMVIKFLKFVNRASNILNSVKNGEII